MCVESKRNTTGERLMPSINANMLTWAIFEVICFHYQIPYGSKRDFVRYVMDNYVILRDYLFSNFTKNKINNRLCSDNVFKFSRNHVFQGWECLKFCLISPCTDEEPSSDSTLEYKSLNCLYVLFNSLSVLSMQMEARC